MSASVEASVVVALLDVSEDVLGQLLTVAIQGADADEVTPPLGSATGWNSERISWFREYHLAASAVLDGLARQRSWAISCDGELAGSIRLKRLGPGTLETGIWLARDFRGRGVGREALRLVKAHAAGSGRRCSRPPQRPATTVPWRSCGLRGPNWRPVRHQRPPRSRSRPGSCCSDSPPRDMPHLSRGQWTSSQYAHSPGPGLDMSPVSLCPGRDMSPWILHGHWTCPIGRLTAGHVLKPKVAAPKGRPPSRCCFKLRTQGAGSPRFEGN